MGERHEHEWERAEMHCPDPDCQLVNSEAGWPHISHPALACDACDTVIDLVREDDPR